MHNLEEICFSMPWTFQQCRTALANNGFCAFGLWIHDLLIAYLSAYHIGNELEILNLGVIPQERNQGHASRLLGAVLQAADKMGMQKAVLEVRRGNSAAIALYKKFGFVHHGTRPRYYADTGEDALIFSRTSAFGLT